MESPKEVSFTGDVDITVEQIARELLQESYSHLPLEVLINSIRKYVLSDQALPEIKRFLYFIKETMQTDDQLIAFATFLTAYQHMFLINDLCEISMALAANGVDFTQMEDLGFANRLLLTEEIMRTLAWKSKQDFFVLFQGTDVERLNYIQVNIRKSESDSEMVLLTAKFKVLILLLARQQVFNSPDLNKLEAVMLHLSRKTRDSIRNCIVALEELAELEIIKKASDIWDRTEFFGLFNMYIEKHWLDPIVAKDIIAEFSRLRFINSAADILGFVKTSFLSMFDSRMYYVTYKAEIFGCWFGDPEIVSLWQKLKSKDFNLQKLQTLLLSAQGLYKSRGRSAPQDIRQEIYDELNSILLNKQYKENRNFLELVRVIPKGMRTFYMLNSCFDIQNSGEAVLMCYHLPLNIQRVYIRENDVVNRFVLNSGTTEIVNSLEQSIKGEENLLSLYNKELIPVPFEFAMSKQVARLEQFGTPLAYFACGLLLANGGSSNPRGLQGKLFLDYQEKRLHDAVKFFNRASEDPSLRRNVTFMKMCMFYKDNSYTVNQRLLKEEKPDAKDSIVLRDDTCVTSSHERISVWM